MFSLVILRFQNQISDYSSDKQKRANGKERSLEVAGELALNHLLDTLVVRQGVGVEHGTQVRRWLAAEQPQELALISTPLGLTRAIQRLRVTSSLRHVPRPLLTCALSRGKQSKLIYNTEWKSFNAYVFNAECKNCTCTNLQSFFCIRL